MNDENRAREFHLSPELRRATMWAIGGCLLLAIVVLCLLLLNAAPGIAKTATATAFFIAIAIGLSQFLLTRIRIDESGLGRRILWWWDWWAWEVFSEGQIRQ